MSPTLIEAARPRFRIKIWMAFLLPALAAPGLLWLLGIDPSRVNPTRRAIEGLKEWAADSFETYYTGETDFSIMLRRADLVGPPVIDDMEFMGGSNCLIKFALVADSGPNKTTDGGSMKLPREAFITQNGSCQTKVHYAHTVRGGCTQISSAKLGNARTLVAALPAAPWRVEPEAALVVGSLQKGRWVVRVYDRSRLPSELVELLRLLPMELR